MVSFQGYLMLMPGLRTTPTPTRAPNHFKSNFFIPDDGFRGLIKKRTLTKYQADCFRREAPMAFLYQSLLYVSLAPCCFIETIVGIFPMRRYLPGGHWQRQKHLRTIRRMPPGP